MKYRILSFVVILTLFTAALAFADADVQNLVLSRQGNRTVLRVDVSEQVTSNQFAVDAKGDKPYRIIVDVKPAIHRLTMKNFMSLPYSAIKSIRTSQYSVDPDRVVRIVLDMRKKLPYEVKYENGYLFIYIEDKAGAEFLTWNSSAVKPPVLAGKDDEEQVKETPVKTEEKPTDNDSIAKPKPKKDEKEVSPFKKDYSGKKPTYTDQKAPSVKPNDKSDNKKVVGDKNPYSGGSGLSPVLSLNKDNKPAPPPKQVQQGIDWSTWQYISPQQSRDLDKEITLAKRFWRPRPPQNVEVAKAAPKPAPPIEVAKVAPKPMPVPPIEVAKVESKPKQTPPPPIPNKTVASKPNPAVAGNKAEKSRTPAPKPVNLPPKPGPKVAAAPLPQDTNPKQSHPIFDNPAEWKRQLAGVTPPPQKTPPNVPPKPQIAVNTPVDTLLEETPSSVDTTTVAQKNAKEEKPTSRFRRKPAFPTKLKGTIVAEFPTRMVIKYTPGSRRDPFETLINETKKSDSPIDKKIPDIETARLVGVLESTNGERRALLEDLDGYGYILKTGDKVKKGYVGKIDSDKAYFRLFEYGWSRTVALYLSHK